MVKDGSMSFLRFVIPTLLCFSFQQTFLKADENALPYERANFLKADLKGTWIEISIQDQKLCLRKGEKAIATYEISTGLKGVGQENNSFQTPLGFHRIDKKIGAEAPLFTIFKSLLNTNRLWDAQTADPNGDYVITRALTLDGLEKGFNKGKDSLGINVDSRERRIYIHGTPYEELIGKPVSHGCIRMKNNDVILFFDSVEIGTTVWIHKGPLFKKSPKFSN